LDHSKRASMFTDKPSSFLPRMVPINLNGPIKVCKASIDVYKGAQ